MAAQVCIETARLILLTVTLQDIDRVAESWRLDEGPISLEAARGRVQWMMDNHAQNMPGRLVHLCLAILDRRSPEIIGWCGLDHRDRSRDNPVLFYLLKQRCWGQGLATEAAQAVLGYAFGPLNLPRIDSAAAADNIASKRVMEKLGMAYLGTDPEGGYNFTMTREAYFRVQNTAGAEAAGSSSH